METAGTIVRRLVQNGFRFRDLKKAGKPGQIQALSLEITHRCIAKCVMCNIWKIPAEVPDLPVEEWLDLLDRDLFSSLVELDVTGGEPFLREDLPDFFAGIGELKAGRLRNLRSVAVTTNGLLTDRVSSFTERIVETTAAAGFDLVMVCAVDAVGGIHDRIRNVPDAWRKVNLTIDALLKLKEKYEHLIVGLKTTILPINVGELEKIAAYADARGLFTIISPYIITEARYLNLDRAKDLTFSPEDKDAMARFFRGEAFRWRYHADRLADFLATGEMKKPCTCGYNYLFVRYSGDIFACPLIGESIGNVRDAEIGDLFVSSRADMIRRQIGRRPECKQCTEPGLERYALPFEGFTYLSLLAKMGEERFLEMHRHMGLDKYLWEDEVRK